MESAQTKPRIRVGRTEMDFPHQGKILTAVHPFYGPANSRTLQNLIRKEGYVESTAHELTSFVHEYFGGSEPQAKEVNQIIEDRLFKGFTGILCVPKKGAFGGLVYFIDYPEFDEEGVVDKENLLKRLDESYAQILFEDFKEGSVNCRKMAKHPYFIAWAGGKEGAEKLAELTSKRPRKEAYIWVPNILHLKEPIARVAALSSGWGNVRLNVVSEDRGGSEGGYAFGLLKKVGEDVALEK